MAICYGYVREAGLCKLQGSVWVVVKGPFLGFDGWKQVNVCVGFALVMPVPCPNRDLSLS